MSHKRLWISAAIIVIIVFITFSFSVPRTSEIDSKASSDVEKTIVPVITLRNSYAKGSHTISGYIEAPNACTTVSASTTVSESEPSSRQILVELYTQSEPGICLQLPTRVSFETKITAPADLPISLLVNGIVATTTAL